MSDASEAGVVRRAEQQGERGGELLVVTQNIWGHVPLWELRRAMMAERLAELRPDIIGLQEIHAGEPHPDRSQAAEIGALLGGYRVWYAPGRVSRSGACEGVALLCREDLEVVAHSVEALTLDRADPFDGENQRIVLRALVRHEGALVDVLVTHLSLSQRARSRTIREIVAFAERERRASGSVGAVLMGDLNAPPSEEAIAALERGEGGWLDTWRHLHGAARGGTWPSGLGLRRLDYIFVQPASRFQVLGCERLHFCGSDHLGVMATLAVR